MASQRFLELLDLLVNLQDVYESLESFKSWGYLYLERKEFGQMIGVPEGEEEEYINFLEELPKLLLEASSSLTLKEADEILKEIKGTEKETALVRINNDPTIPAKLKYKAIKAFWPNERLGGKGLSSAIKQVSVLERPPGLDSLEAKEFLETKQKTLAKFTSLKKLYDAALVDDQFIVGALDLVTLKEPDDIEYVCQHLARLIVQTKSIETLEQIVVFWKNILPEIAEQRLRRLFIETQDLEAKENVKNALILVSQNPLAIGDQIMGDSIQQIGDFRGSNIAIKSTLRNVTQTIDNSELTDQATKNELNTLIARLEELLQQAPQENTQEAQAVAETAKMLIDTATQENPNKYTKQITADGLLKAAENIAKVLPAVLPIVKQIIALIV